jgi:hypothetical protein
MNIERKQLIAQVRGEIVGPSLPNHKPTPVVFSAEGLTDPLDSVSGPVTWLPQADGLPQEVLYFDNESPKRKYGSGALYPLGYLEEVSSSSAAEDDEEGSDAVPDREDNLVASDDEDAKDEPADVDEITANDGQASAAEDYDFPVSSPEIYKPSTMGISFCAELGASAVLLLRLPTAKRFFWQSAGSDSFQVNGRYEVVSLPSSNPKKSKRKVWRRHPLAEKDVLVKVPGSALEDGKPLAFKVPTASSLDLSFEVFPRAYSTDGRRTGQWILTVVLKNGFTWKDGVSDEVTTSHTLFQSHFDVTIEVGSFLPYPQGLVRNAMTDPDEMSLDLLYATSQTWAVGHGCSACWDDESGQVPAEIYADSMPAVELPSMTPDIEVDGNPLVIPMRNLFELDDGVSRKSPGWSQLDKLVSGYDNWILKLEDRLRLLTSPRRETAERHIESCKSCLRRMKNGLSLLSSDLKVLEAFRLANRAMLLQQIAAKSLDKRKIIYDAASRSVRPVGPFKSPAELLKLRVEEGQIFGKWRAFQIAFLLMSIEGVSLPSSADRETVDLIWFPTGGGKTEAYLGVMSYLMFYKRLADEKSSQGHGTVALMRYTLRMLTTQQFQRASSLICAMEQMRREDEAKFGEPVFSIGLWLGGAGSPNTTKAAKTEINRFKDDKIKGNPLVLTECPWCRCSIGMAEGSQPPKMKTREWKDLRLGGVKQDGEIPRLVCPDSACDFGKRDPKKWIPVEVVDELIYNSPPSLVIATADKLAMLAYRPQAGTIFGVKHTNGKLTRIAPPPSLIIQDELHLISGPLGTMYGLYESVFEDLCTDKDNGHFHKPKIIASTATIRGAAAQVKSVYNRDNIQLFPSPGLEMSDSFFGKYARSDDGKLKQGRLYLGIHANGYGSIMTAQVRAFATSIFAPWFFKDQKSKDPWWTLLAFYNSIRELGGAKTLFSSDIRSRLKYMFNREGVDKDKRRKMGEAQELTSRLSQAEIVQMMDMLNVSLNQDEFRCLSACLASNIIEVGVDIDRLSLMGVVGQPKSTSSYIQITGRVGRRWWDRPGLILTIYNPSKSRDRSHFEQFHSYHRRLYEKVEPTSATPFSISALRRGMSGAVLSWVRQRVCGPLNSASYIDEVDEACDMMRERCKAILNDEVDLLRTIQVIDEIQQDIKNKWAQNPQSWESYPAAPEGEYLMLWPGQFYTDKQKSRGLIVPTSMRQVDTTSELGIPQIPL